jgi:putative CocE/NonD family hydrolase
MSNRPSGTAPGQRHLNGMQTTGRKFRNLTEPAYQVSQANDVPAPMRDGVELMTDIYRPDADGRVPALLAYSCYPRQMQNLRAPAGVIEAGASDFFVPRGYAHVIANARSTSGSGGTWGMLDSSERDDLYDLVEWVAAQPWCDGNVGMLGISYFAMAQIAAAASRPPNLKAIFALGTNESVFDVVWHHGLLSSGFFSTWISAVGILGEKSSKFWRSKGLELAGQVFSNSRVHAKLANVNGEAAVTMLKSVLRSHYPEEPFGRIWQQACVEHPTYDAFWADRDCAAALADVDIPVYLGCDWDNVVMHLPGTFTSWKALARNPNVRMSLLPEGGLNWPWESMHYEALAWYDHWLKGIDTGVMDGPAIRWYLPGAGEWRTAQQWPPPESSIGEYALRADGALGRDEGEPGSRSYLYLPAGSGRPRNASPPGLPDRLTWETLAMTELLDIAGNIELRLDATITALDTAWIAVLYDVAPDGAQTVLSAGWLRAMLRTVNEQASIPGTPVIECREPAAIDVGEPVTYRIPIAPNARRISPGHRLRLTLTSSDQAKDAPKVLGFTHTPLGGSSLNTVHSSSRLLLPVMDMS